MKYYNTTNSPIATPDGEGGHFWFPAMGLSEDIPQEKVDRLIELEPSLAYLLGSTIKPEATTGAPALVITEPVAGSTVPPVHTIAGTGAIPYSTVELWHVEADTMVATTVADGGGGWVFDGDTPASLGEVTWAVKSEGKVVQESAPLSITVAEPEGEPTRKGANKDPGLTGGQIASSGVVAGTVLSRGATKEETPVVEGAKPDKKDDKKGG